MIPAFRLCNRTRKIKVISAGKIFSTFAYQKALKKMKSKATDLEKKIIEHLGEKKMLSLKMESALVTQ